MLYLNEKDIIELHSNWHETIDTIEKAVRVMADNEYSQPIKPYLRYGNLQNRIIAMPSFVGGDINMAGIKWIASFPNNVSIGVNRASSVVILNNAGTGQVESIINTSLLSAIRTASVTGLMIKYFLKSKKNKNTNVGIIGFGPIGQQHLKMCDSILGDNVANYYLYDKRPVITQSDVAKMTKCNTIIADNWTEVYQNADIFICCTVADEPYIDIKPKKGALILNVSLRDFKNESYEFLKNNIIVDDWDEVCRENTTIELWNKAFGLKKENTKSIIDVVVNKQMEKYNTNDNVMFNPMGMGVFDIAISTYFYRKAKQENIGYIND